MEDLRRMVVECIRSQRLPDTLQDFPTLFFDVVSSRFDVQESLHWDFKDAFPEKLESDFGGGILRLICGFHNTYGGLVIFGVKDETRIVIGNKKPLDIERLNAFIRERLTSTIECVHRAYKVNTESGEVNIDIALVPKRPSGVPPIRFVQSVGKYEKDIIYRRQGHEVLEATSGDLPILYQPRDDFGLLDKHEITKPVERLMPPSDATVREFIGRRDVLDRLWHWLVFDDDPRLYLYGRGGSGKSTIAYDFAKRVAEHGGDIINSDGNNFNLVLYLSAKERFLDPNRAEIVKSLNTDFTSAREQFEIILGKSIGFGIENIDQLNDTAVVEKLKEFLNTFVVLIVIDDIDTITTKGNDSGSDTLYRLLARSSVGGKVLYTMREEPLLSANQSEIIPGLDRDLEYFDFVEACCKQFGVPVPAPEILFGNLEDKSERLPLVLETIIGFRRTTANYNDAIDLWESKRGEEAREYLFRREYDRLPADNRSRNLLYLLALLAKPTSTSVLLSILQYTPAQLQDAIAAVKDLFVTVDHFAEGETLFSMGAVTSAFILHASSDLPHYETLKERIRYFTSELVPITPEVRAVIYQIERRLGEKDVVGAREFLESVQVSAEVSEHPKFKKAAGEVYAAQKPPDIDSARKFFQSAYDADLLDRSMMRTWFYMELNKGLFTKAAEICRKVTSQEKFSPTAVSEFWSKIGMARVREARQASNLNPTTSAKKFVSALNAYATAIEVLLKNDRLDPGDSFSFYHSCLMEFTTHCIRFDLHDEFFDYWARDSFSPSFGFDSLHDFIFKVCEKTSYAKAHLLSRRKGALHKLRNKIDSNKTTFRNENFREEILAIIDKTIKEIGIDIAWQSN